MQAGQLRHRIALQSPGPAVDEFGQPIPGAANWQTVSTVWAAIRPVGSTERLAAAQQQSAQTHVITTRWAAELAAATGAWRIVMGDRTFAVTGLPRCPGEARQWLVWDASETRHG